MDRLTAQDLQLWTLLASGMGDRGHRRSDAGVRTHRQTDGGPLLKKIGVTNRIAVAAKAGQFGLLDERSGR